jgi:IS5 family transposase
MDKNRCLEQLMNIEDAIDRARLESVVMSHYTVGKSEEGADAYSPLVLFKCLLLQWSHINSDPELESQMNDELSFKKFFGLSFSDPSTDHSTFSRFRKRWSKRAMDQINSEILRQFYDQGLTISEGITTDVRLVRSASRRISNKEIKERNLKKS